MGQGGEAAPAGAKELRTFGLVLGSLFATFFGVWPLMRHRASPAWPWMVTGVLWLSALIWPAALSYLVEHSGGIPRRWSKHPGHPDLLFAIAIVPVGLVMRLLGRDRMARKLDPDCASYRVPSRPRPDKDMERPY
jgi:hypothetical protein